MMIDRLKMTRRRFLGVSAAIGAGWLCGRPVAAAPVATDPDRFVLLADTHIWENRDQIHRNVKPADNFSRLRNEILALRPHPAGAIFVGDLVFLQGHPADYAVLADLIRPLREAALPLHFALGNHDRREAFWAALPEAKPAGKPAVPGKHVAIIPAQRANWFLLDSLEKTNSTPGVLGQAQLEWLAKELDARPDKPALVVAHHPRDPSGAIQGLKDTGPLFDVLAPRKQVKAYVFGHTHRWHVSQYRDIHLINVPATAWVFDAKEPQGWVDVRLRGEGMTLVLNALDKEHKSHGQKVDLSWRT